MCKASLNIRNSLQTQYKHTHLVYTMNLTTLSSFPLSSTHIDAFDAHLLNIENMAMKQGMLLIYPKHNLQLFNDKHLPTFLLNLGIGAFWYKCDKTNLYCICVNKLVWPLHMFIHIQSSTCENFTCLNHNIITSKTNWKQKVFHSQ
jgi:hypothetical protein